MDKSICTICGHTEKCMAPNCKLCGYCHNNPIVIARVLGKRGGEATKRKLGREHFKRISKLGVEARQK